MKTANRKDKVSNNADKTADVISELDVLFSHLKIAPVVNEEMKKAWDYPVNTYSPSLNSFFLHYDSEMDKIRLNIPTRSSDKVQFTKYYVPKNWLRPLGDGLHLAFPKDIKPTDIMKQVGNDNELTPGDFKTLLSLTYRIHGSFKSRSGVDEDYMQFVQAYNSRYGKFEEYNKVMGKELVKFDYRFIPKKVNKTTSIEKNENKEEKSKLSAKGFLQSNKGFFDKKNKSVNLKNNSANKTQQRPDGLEK